MKNLVREVPQVFSNMIMIRSTEYSILLDISYFISTYFFFDVKAKYDGVTRRLDTKQLGDSN